MKYQAVGKKVIVKVANVETTTKAGILIPQLAKETPNTGEVISIGSEVTSVKVGQTVLFKKWEGWELKIDGNMHMVLEDDPKYLLAIYE